MSTTGALADIIVAQRGALRRTKLALFLHAVNCWIARATIMGSFHQSGWASGCNIYAAQSPQFYPTELQILYTRSDRLAQSKQLKYDIPALPQEAIYKRRMN
jgi:hypothetical protein